MLNKLLNETEEKENIKRKKEDKNESAYELVKLLGSGTLASLIIVGGSYLMAWGMTGENTPKEWGKYINQVNTQQQIQYKQQKQEIKEEESFFHKIFYKSEKESINKENKNKSKLEKELK